ncbi:response regulator transcription factor [Paraburkholderia sp. DHOC27]|uniref:response regulator transcription factor n=1 Tax=Paraburkholderia sp. DHOC27 TaxID=2303330 RepID=UPI000E3CA6F1|nr:response regulator transcription factor [Paraburkholderia sp. DHOC27]RFU49143.1 DNA-binding response regulator [Paraburkholderia sp. DHOC27]
MLRVLNIHDEPALGQVITASLTSSGFSVDMTHLGLTGVTRAINHDYDVVVLGQTLPDVSGPAVVSTLRGVGIQIPVLMVSNTSDTAQRIQGLRAGADDYLATPFSPEEMLARVEVLLRKRARHTRDSALLRTQHVELDLIKRKLVHAGRKQSLLPTECRLLEFMMQHAGRVLTRCEMFESVWGHHFDPGTNLIDVHVGKLRRKLAALGLPPLIITVRGAGYRFEGPTSGSPHPA